MSFFSIKHIMFFLATISLGFSGVIFSETTKKQLKYNIIALANTACLYQRVLGRDRVVKNFLMSVPTKKSKKITWISPEIAYASLEESGIHMLSYAYYTYNLVHTQFKRPFSSISCIKKGVCGAVRGYAYGVISENVLPWLFKKLNVERNSSAGVAVEGIAKFFIMYGICTAEQTIKDRKFSPTMPLFSLVANFQL